MLKHEPALKHGLFVGLLAIVIARFVGVEVTDDDRMNMDVMLGAGMMALHLGQGLLQGWLTRRKVVPVKTIKEAGLDPSEVKAMAANPNIPAFKS